MLAVELKTTNDAYSIIPDYASNYVRVVRKSKDYYALVFGVRDAFFRLTNPFYALVPAEVYAGERNKLKAIERWISGLTLPVEPSTHNVLALSMSVYRELSDLNVYVREGRDCATVVIALADSGGYNTIALKRVYKATPLVITSGAYDKIFPELSSVALGVFTIQSRGYVEFVHHAFGRYAWSSSRRYLEYDGSKVNHGRF